MAAAPAESATPNPATAAPAAAPASPAAPAGASTAAPGASAPTGAAKRAAGTSATPNTPAAKTVDSSNFEGALLEFSNLRAAAAVDKAGPGTGLNNPAAIITVKFDDGKKEERVTFGRPGPGPDVFASRPDQPGALKVETGKFDDAVKKLDSIQ